MSTYRVSGTILLESTGEEAVYDIEMENWDHLPDPISILEHMMQTGEIQIIPSHWEKVDE